MGKKHGKKGAKKNIVLSLAEFNEDAGIGGVDPELAALPSAPKAAAEWEAQGGRPEYNSRGYKERTSSSQRDNFDADFDDRDWSRKGPLEERENSSTFGLGGADRDWGDMRRGPMEQENGPGAGPERDWNDMRRGPVQSSFETNPNAGGGERDWGARRGPVEAAAPSGRAPISDDAWGSRRGPVEAAAPSGRAAINDEAWGSRRGPVEAAAPSGRTAINDDAWGSVRKGAVEAEFSQNGAAVDHDWSVRRPVDADAGSRVAEADWGAPRKGPVDSDFAGQTDAPKRDWSARKGPIEAEAPRQAQVSDWGDVRRAPIEAETVQLRKEEAEVDWTSRRGPVASEVESAQKGLRDIDFKDVRSGAKLRELGESERGGGRGRISENENGPVERETWRRDGRKGLHDRPASTGHDAVSMDRDWGAARRSHPVSTNPKYGRTFKEGNAPSQDEPSSSTNKDIEEQRDGRGDDWTTVRNQSRRPAPPNLRNRARRSSVPKRGELQKSSKDVSGDGPTHPGAIGSGNAPIAAASATPAVLEQ